MAKAKHAELNNNAALAAIFHRMASCYRFLGKEDRFRAIAYENAARTLGNMQEDIAGFAGDKKKLDQLSGIGESIAGKIIEYLSTGKIRTYEKLKKKVPEGLLGLMEVHGFGPSSIKTLHSKLKIKDADELVDAIGKGRLQPLRGFGPKKIENIRRGLKLFKESHNRLLLWNARRIAAELMQELNKIPGIITADVAGSLRRKKETIGDIDLVIAAEKNQDKRIISKFLAIPQCKRVLVRGATRASFLLKATNFQVDIRLVRDDEYGAALLYLTGSKEHNIQLRTMAKARGWKLNEYGLFETGTGKRLAGRTEKDIYRMLGMDFIEPELREQRGEMDAAKKNKLPKLVELSQIRGDLQMHSNWSDGAAGIETIARHILKKFPAYEYIVITDHSPAQRIAGGMKPGEFKKQFREIAGLNKKLGRELVKKGAEVDILADGSLDLPDDLLEQCEWVVASVHSRMAADNTARLIAACEHPLVHCIAHPSGRLLGKRDAYPVDWKSLFEKAASTGTSIEINAQPNRMDLKDDLVKTAIGAGVMITINTDAHDLNQFDYMELGVDMARRGWCEKKHILNTQSWKSLEQIRERKRKKTGKQAR